MNREVQQDGKAPKIEELSEDELDQAQGGAARARKLPARRGPEEEEILL